MYFSIIKKFITVDFTHNNRKIIVQPEGLLPLPMSHKRGMMNKNVA